MSAFMPHTTSPSSRLGVVVRLRQQNEDIRSELRAVNSQLNDLLTSHVRKPLNPVTLHSKSLSNARTHLSHYEAQLRILLKRQQNFSFSTIQELTATLEELSQAVKEKEASNRATERTQEAFDSRLTEGNPPITALLNHLSESIRFKQSQIDHIETELKKGEESFNLVLERTQKADKAFNLLLEQGAVDPDYTGRPIFTPDDGYDLAQIKAKIEGLTQQKAAIEADFKQKALIAESEYEKTLKEVTVESEVLREKEQKRRICELKVSETARNFRVLTKKNAKLSLALKGGSIGSSGNYTFLTAEGKQETELETPQRGRKVAL